MTHYTAHKVGVRMNDIRCSAKLGNGRSAGLAGQYRLSVSVFGRMCYVTFGILSISAESKTSAFGPLVETDAVTKDGESAGHHGHHSR